MGDPKKTRKKYSTPRHPWEKTRIEEEAEIVKKYALKNKKQIWKMNSILKSYKEQAKKLSKLKTAQSEKETKMLFSKLMKLGLIEESNFNNILNLKIEDIMERRLQTIVVKRGLSRSMMQSRQFITHGHVRVGTKVITSPAYLVAKTEEGKVNFKQSSTLSDADHPERQIIKPKEKIQPKEKKAEE